MRERSEAPHGDGAEQFGWSGGGAAALNGDLGFAKRADEQRVVLAQDALLAGIEARLAEEVRGLVAALDQFGRRTQLIGKELPEGAHFCKAVTGLLGLLGFQFAYALGKGLDRPIFVDDGAEYLRELSLSLNDLIREVDLDGRRFLAVALIEQSASEILGVGQGADKR